MEVNDEEVAESLRLRWQGALMNWPMATLLMAGVPLEDDRGPPAITGIGSLE